MTRPELPEDLKIARKSRESEIKVALYNRVQNKVLEELFSTDTMSHIDIALGIDKRAILKEVLLALADSLAENTVGE